MNIMEAVSTAIESGRCIKRQTPIWKQLKVKPTNGEECFIIYGADRGPAPRWNPTADDILATDWILC